MQVTITPGTISDFYVESLVNDDPKGTFIDAISSYQLQSHSISAAGPDIKWNHSSTAPNINSNETHDKGDSFFAMNVARSAAKKPAPETESWKGEGVREGLNDEVNQWSMDNVDHRVDGDEAHIDWMHKLNNNSKRKYGSSEVYEDTSVDSANDERIGWKKSGDEGQSSENSILCHNKNVWSESRVHSVNRQMKWFISEPNLRNKTVKFR